MLDDYASNSSEELDYKINVRMVFLPGVHVLTKELLISRTKNITLVGCDSNHCPSTSGSMEHHKTVRITLSQSNIVLDNFSRADISNLSIDGRNKNIFILKIFTMDAVMNIDNVTLVGSALLIKQRTSTVQGRAMVALSDIVFNGSRLMVNLVSTSNITIQDVIFYLGPGSRALTFCGIMSHIYMLNVTTLNGSYGFITELYCTGYHIDSKRDCDLAISESTNTISVHRYLVITISGSSLMRPFGAGICVLSSPGVKSWPRFLSLAMVNSVVSSHNEGGIDIDTGYLSSLILFLQNTVISSNTNSGLFASGLSIQRNSKDIAISILLKNSSFENNMHLLLGASEEQTTVFLSAVVNVTVENCQFINNYGSAIKAIDVEESGITFVGHTTFRNNTAYRGGALYLYNSVISLELNSTLLIQENQATDVGGAVYTDQYDQKIRKITRCFFQRLSWIPICSESSDCYNLIFINNSAINGGDAIFGTISTTCVFTNLIFKPFFNNGYKFSFISSTPSRVCLCQKQRAYTDYYIKSSCINVSQILVSKSVHPGEEFHLKAVLVGDMFGTGTGSVYAQFLNQEMTQQRKQVELKPTYQYSQRVDDYKQCQTLIYTVYSFNSREVMVLTANGATVVSVTDKQTLKNDIKQYKKKPYRILNTCLLYTSPSPRDATLSRMPSSA